MLSVILKMLAVIGTIILVLLGIILLLILIVLFLPITYTIQGKITENKKEASAKVQWLFGIVRFTLHYSDQLSYKLKVLWFDLTGLIRKEAKPETLHKTESSNDSKTSTISADSNDSKDTSFSEDVNNLKTSNTSETSGNSETLHDTEDSESSEESVSLTDKVNKLIFKIKSIYAKIKDILNNISYYINLLKEEDTKALLSHCMKVIFNILKSIRPRTLKIDAEIGFDSPDTTGKVYGLLCMLYPYYGEDIHITPDFEKQILSGTLFCKGRVFVCVLLVNALRILFDRKLYKVIHKLKNGGKRNGR